MTAIDRRKELVPFTQFRHFKGGVYQVLTLAEKEDTGEQLVIYQALYGDHRIYARNAESFLSEVDHVKYPEASQQYRFEMIQGQERKESTGQEPAGISRRGCGQGDAPGQTATSPQETLKQETLGHDAPEQESKALSGQEPVQEKELDPLLEQFLDARTTRQRLELLDEMRGHITNEMIDTIAISLGVEVDESNSVKERYEDLRNCLVTIHKYETERGRLR